MLDIVNFTKYCIFCIPIHIVQFLFPWMWLSYLEIVWSFWGLLLIFARWDQNSLVIWANFAHYWDNTLLSTLLNAPGINSFYFLFFSGGDTNCSGVSARDCSLFSLQGALSAPLAVFLTYIPNDAQQICGELCLCAPLSSLVFVLWILARVACLDY